MQLIQFALTLQRWFWALVCAAFSLVWYGVVWGFIVRVVRDGDAPDIKATVVLVAAAGAAYLLSRWAYLLARGPRNGRPLLRNAFLWGAAVMFAGLALVGVVAPEPNFDGAVHVFLLAVSAALLAYARSGEDGA